MLVAMPARLTKKLLLTSAATAVLVVLIAPSLSTGQPTPLNSVIRSVPVKQKVIALTFDDGPDPRFTPRLVRMLDDCGAKATFFMIGKQMLNHPSVVDQVMASGHEIANHTFTHPTNLLNTPPAVVSGEMHRCESVIRRFTGQKQFLFRPPKGFIDPSLLTVADVQGYKTVLWTVCANHKDATTPEAMAKRVIDRIGPGAIILAHDGRYSSRWKDVEATRIIIRRLQKEGYTFVTVSDLLLIGGKL